MSTGKEATVEPKTLEAQSDTNSHAGAITSAGIVSEDPAVRDFYGDAVSEVYRMKSDLASQHLADIGMGKFQWMLFVVTGFGWIVDNFWSQGISAVRPAVANEFTDITRLSFSSVAYYVGMILGASFWGTTADMVGRKPAFNATILIGGIFACAVAGTQNFVAFCSLWAVIGTAAGGNVPVDSIIFLEFMPPAKQWLLVSLSAWWNLGQVIVALLSWVFLANYACPSSQAPCSVGDNMGWRYLMITLGAIAIAFGLIRILAFKIPESPRYLLSKGRDADAVEAVNYIARFNGKPETLSLAMLEEIDAQFTQTPGGQHPATTTSSKGLSQMQILKESFKDYDTSSFKRLFSGRRMARHSSVTFLIWLTIGIAYPLYFAFITSYLQTKSTYSANSSLSHTYMIYCIVSAVGVLGPVAAGFCVETRLGRRWMMALSAILTGVFLFLYTLAKTEAADVGFQCATGILGNFGTFSTESLLLFDSFHLANLALQSTQSCLRSRPNRSQAPFVEPVQESLPRC
ncbi:hypothetical protein N0V87_009081 [Didymella glomerata]|uniref:Major facilitator superfamily (MFS) profile domain-containing protein n=1 Tax=Didymella glomerata TaxID=749621 RepID=A0A9W9BWB0_9PLEO|nr:hypothetical protein N0V87_009081 [Didymella glomerata]